MINESKTIQVAVRWIENPNRQRRKKRKFSKSFRLASFIMFYSVYGQREWHMSNAPAATVGRIVDGCFRCCCLFGCCCWIFMKIISIRNETMQIDSTKSQQIKFDGSFLIDLFWFWVIWRQRSWRFLPSKPPVEECHRPAIICNWYFVGKYSHRRGHKPRLF